MQPSNVILSKTNKEAVVNDMTDKYYKKNLTEEYLSQMKQKYGIVLKDILKEIIKREIGNSIGK